MALPTPIGINVNFSSITNFTSSAPLPRQTAFDGTNPNYVRRVTLLNDSILLTYFTQSVVIPYSSLYNAAASVTNVLTWPPYIVVQPTGSTVTHPTSSYFAVSASSELPITYSWWSSSMGTGPFLQLTNSLSGFMGTNTRILTDATSSVSDNGSLFYCYVSNTRGAVSSSVVSEIIN